MSTTPGKAISLARLSWGFTAIRSACTVLAEHREGSCKPELSLPNYVARQAEDFEKKAQTGETCWLSVR
jgi:hypothetical protein